METDRNLTVEVDRNHKPNHKDLYLCFDSHHHLEQKLGIIRTLHNWAKNIPSKMEGIGMEKVKKKKHTLG